MPKFVKNKMDRGRKKIILQMFDIRPINKDGELDLAVVSRAAQSTVRLRQEKDNVVGVFCGKEKVGVFKEKERAKREANTAAERAKIFQLGRSFDAGSVPVIYRSEMRPRPDGILANSQEKIVFSEEGRILAEKNHSLFNKDTTKYFERIVEPLRDERERVREIFFDTQGFFSGDSSCSQRVELPKARGRKMLVFSAAASAVFLVFFVSVSVLRGFGARDSLIMSGADAYGDLAEAQDSIRQKNFERSALAFTQAYEKFDQLSKDIDQLGGVLTEVGRYFPVLSKVSSGSHLAQAGRNISRIGVLSGEVMKAMTGIKNPLTASDDPVSFLKLFQDTQADAKEIVDLLDDTQKHLDLVVVTDVPDEKRLQFIQLRDKLPVIRSFARAFVNNSQTLTDVLGGNGPRKYLFLFQNNQELRATGGFVGTYGVLDIFNGRIRKFFVDGIFNPDGQLTVNVVPPVPLQKITGAWSLHDSNWFPDFPKSAEKAMWFYEKTGGPTVDGVITMTPTVMERLLEVTGPIDMPEYGVTVDRDNFIETIQYEVEVDYDKELNQPKKILSDLAPEILDRLFNMRSAAQAAQAMQILVDSLDEKQILIYSKNYEIERKLSDLGWSGEMLATQKDYLSIINTNINGYKTDGMIDQKIEHRANIQPDGSIIDSVTITRQHNGGSTEHEWWNKVNADYMRVYVPKGSQLISVSGQTREFNKPPLDYDALGFRRDPTLSTEEQSMYVDEESGTRVYEDSGKTVFGNWVYVSPQETVTVKYEYLLPFRLDIGRAENSIETYSVLVQKQAGSLGGELKVSVKHPEKLRSVWNYPEAVTTDGANIQTISDLTRDRFFGMAFVVKKSE